MIPHRLTSYALFIPVQDCLPHLTLSEMAELETFITNQF